MKDLFELVKKGTELKNHVMQNLEVCIATSLFLVLHKYFFQGVI